MSGRTFLLKQIARVTRRWHPRGTERMLRFLHHPEKRSWSIRAVVDIGDDIRMEVDTSSYIEWRIFFFAGYESHVTAQLQRLMKPGESAIDVGANIGVHTLHMARLTGDGIVLACEPEPDTRSRLIHNIALNPGLHIEVVPLAISDAPGRAHLYVPDDAQQPNRGLASLQGQVDHLRTANTIEVDVTNLDELVAAHPGIRIGMIKIDVEGLEPAVVAGARQLLERDRPNVILEHDREHWATSGYDLRTVQDIFDQLGYQPLQELTLHGLRPIPSDPPTFMYILARPSALG